MNTKELIEAFAENIRSLPIELIRIATPDGPKEVGGLLLGEWALNENAKGWTTTHQRTGHCGESYATPIEALISLGILIGAGLTIPDELTAETVSAGIARIPDVAAVANRIKAGLAVLGNWDLDLDYNEPEVEEEQP